MSGTRRTPLVRRSAVQISPRALELFVELERARRARRHAVDCTISEQGLCTTDCRACRRWWDLHDELHVELRLNPWQWPCIPRNPYPPGSPKARDWHPDTEQEELWNLLNEARRAHVSDSSPHGRFASARITRESKQEKAPAAQEDAPRAEEPR
jgi:hypothetical protein